MENYFNELINISSISNQNMHYVSKIVQCVLLNSIGTISCLHDLFA